MLILNLARIESAKLAKLARIESAKVRINFFLKQLNSDFLRQTKNCLALLARCLCFNLHFRYTKLLIYTSLNAFAIFLCFMS